MKSKYKLCYARVELMLVSTFVPPINHEIAYSLVSDNDMECIFSALFMNEQIRQIEQTAIPSMLFNSL